MAGSGTTQHASRRDGRNFLTQITQFILTNLCPCSLQLIHTEIVSRSRWLCTCLTHVVHAYLSHARKTTHSTTPDQHAVVVCMPHTRGARIPLPRMQNHAHRCALSTRCCAVHWDAWRTVAVLKALHHCCADCRTTFCAWKQYRTGLLKLPVQCLRGRTVNW